MQEPHSHSLAYCSQCRTVVVEIAPPRLQRSALSADDKTADASLVDAVVWHRGHSGLSSLAEICCHTNTPHQQMK